MGTYINYSIKTRADLQDWILSDLGHPLITVELTTEHLNHAIDEALEAYTEYAEMQEDYLVVPLSGYKSASGGLSLSAWNVKSIFTMDEEWGSGGINTLFSVENQMANAGIIPMNFGAQGALTTYEMANSFISVARRMLCQKFDFNYNPRTQRLKLYPDPIQQNKTGFIILGVKIVPPEEDLVGELYVKRLALAKAKMILGKIRSKFTGVVLPGGASIDESIGEEGGQEWSKWIDDIVKNVGPHNGWYIG